METMYCKLLAIGDYGVGKSSLTMRFAHDKFASFIDNNTLDDNLFKTVNLSSQVIQLEILDTGGQELFRTLGASCYRGVHGFLLVFDVTNKDSFCALDKHLANINAFGLKAPKKPYVILVGNKCDLESERVIDFETGKHKAEELCLEYMETSPKLSINVEEVFIKVVSEIQHKKNMEFL